MCVKANDLNVILKEATDNQLRNMAQVCLDLHAALGVKWGDDPYAKIEKLKRSSVNELYVASTLPLNTSPSVGLVKGRYWTCVIGPAPDSVLLPTGCDGPMRSAVQLAFDQVVGRRAEGCWSGWGVNEERAARILMEICK